MKKSFLKSVYPVFIIILVTAFPVAEKSSADECDWNTGDSYKMHWPQEPDMSLEGVDVSMFLSVLADDFECSSTGPITDIHIWGSFINDILPQDGADSLTFEISIYSDIPAQGDIMSKPGDLLWTRTFGPGEYSFEIVYEGLEGWYEIRRDRYYPFNNWNLYQYNFCIEDDPFIQNQGTVYWLVIDEIEPEDPYSAGYKFGWKTTALDLRWNDNAVCLIDGEDDWIEMVYPSSHSYKNEKLDLAFVITGDGEAQGIYDWGDAPDWASAAGYPTLSTNNGAYHIIGGPWFGDDTDQPDAELNGQPEANALGDDLDIEPLFSIGTANDDEDGVYIPPLFQGQPADITLAVNGGGGYVDAWIDFDQDKDWEASERICSWYLSDGIQKISFIVPDYAVDGKTFARFRISTEGGLTPWGPARSGEVEDHEVTIYDSCTQCTGKEFIRGDVDQDTEVTDVDVSLIMNYVLSGAPTPDCMDAADADDNGVVDISDATYILHYFNGGPVIPEPYPNCGLDPTDDTLTCDIYEGCPNNTITTSNDAKWFNVPDVTKNGIDIRIDSSDGTIRRIADDFECRNTNLLTDIHLWCSWASDVKGVIKKININIYSDDPIGPVGNDPENEFSKPNPGVLWEMEFLPGQFQETLYYTVPDPGSYWLDSNWLSIGADKQIWRIDIDIDPNDAFLQQGTEDDPQIYWLEVLAETKDGKLGWKTRRWPDHYMDDAVIDEGTELPRIWKELQYPVGHPYNGLENDSIDMAFCLTYTHTDSMPTSRPVSETQCPVAATQCPTVATRCPSDNTQCPVVQTQCPAVQTQCVAVTMCPPVATTCPVATTQCPAAVTECPVYETRCPRTGTACPAVYTQCPTAETVCPVTETKCPEEDTRCPEVYTQCPELETACVAITTCPPTETSCPVATTQCPAVDTQCPVTQTKCPEYSTRCPVVYTQCPASETQCNAEDTVCPAVDTQCPVINTTCPLDPVYTQCPEAETRCPPLETECPAATTKCPLTETQCNAEDTVCPAIDTQCPVIDTKCPLDSVYTQCPETETRCPPLETECPAVTTKCPPAETQCNVEETVCPAVDTECPAVETECPAVDTECPMTETICSGCYVTVYPTCDLVTMTPDCSMVTITPDCLGSNGTRSIYIERECPVAETECPTVISIDVLAKSL